MMNTRIDQLLDFLNDDPDDAFLLFALAQEYGHAGEIQQAREYYTTLRTKHPDYIALYYHLGKLEEHSGNTVAARETYEEGIARAGLNPHAMSELRVALSQLISDESD